MAASDSLVSSILKGMIWQLEEDGTISQTERDRVQGETPIFAEAVTYHNSKVGNVSA